MQGVLLMRIIVGQGPVVLSIGDNAVTSSIRIAQVFSDLVGKQDSRFMEGLRGNVKIYN